ncbi:hypothetical protein CEXT_78781 [Caerostris extrusa]|uniref:Uncharacterized protein n=1 Tax=Caerostris extrusa TaxID=172846 RepID=A0AAV4N824_CAEEX|nr:hypothetical protein CEXT_78781 [Caerostris extrusa]
MQKPILSRGILDLTSLPNFFPHPSHRMLPIRCKLSHSHQADHIYMNIEYGVIDYSQKATLQIRARVGGCRYLPPFPRSICVPPQFWKARTEYGSLGIDGTGDEELLLLNIVVVMWKSSSSSRIGK